MKRTLLSIKTYEFLVAQYAERTLGYDTQKQIAEAFTGHTIFQPIVVLAEEYKQITSAYFAGSEKNIKTHHTLELEQNKLTLSAYGIISTLTSDQATVKLSNKIISNAKRHYMNEIKKIFMIESDETQKNKYIATIVDLSSNATTAIDISLGSFGHRSMIEHLLKQKKILNIRMKYNVDRCSNDINKLHILTKKAISEPQVISDIKSILNELYKTYSGILDSRLGIK